MPKTPNEIVRRIAQMSVEANSLERELRTLLSAEPRAGFDSWQHRAVGRWGLVVDMLRDVGANLQVAFGLSDEDLEEREDADIRF